MVKRGHMQAWERGRRRCYASAAASTRPPIPSAGAPRTSSGMPRLGLLPPEGEAWARHLEYLGRQDPELTKRLPTAVRKRIDSKAPPSVPSALTLTTREGASCRSRPGT